MYTTPSFEGMTDEQVVKLAQDADGAALEYLNSIGMPAVNKHEHELLVYAMSEMRKIPGLHLIGNATNKAGVLSFVLDGHDIFEVGEYLNGFGIAVRSGHHCAQPLQQRLKIGLCLCRRFFVAFRLVRNGGILLPQRRQQGRRFKNPDDPMFTITVTDRNGVVYNGLIRKLMPLECWRLQGFTDEQFAKAKAAGISNAQLYKQAGNAVTVNVIEALANFIKEIEKENTKNE